MIPSRKKNLGGPPMPRRIIPSHHPPLRRSCSPAMTTTLETAPSPEIDGTGLIRQDPWLAPHTQNLADRQRRYREAVAKFEATGGLLGDISQGFRHFGFNRGEL